MSLEALMNMAAAQSHGTGVPPVNPLEAIEALATIPELLTSINEQLTKQSEYLARLVVVAEHGEALAAKLADKSALSILTGR